MSDTDDSDDDVAIRGSLPMIVGNLSGRMRAHEMRMDRHEAWVGEKFTSLDGKVDGITNGISELKQLLAAQAGGKAALRILLQPAFILWGSVLSGAVALALHFLFKAQQ